MKTKITKSLFIQMMGIAMANCLVLGYNPIAISYFSALLSTSICKWLSFPLMLVGLYISMGIMGTVKYGLCMLLVLVAGEIYERKTEKSSVLFYASSAAFVTVVMETGDAAMTEINYKVALTIMLLGVMVFSLTTIFTHGLGAFMKQISKSSISNEEMVSMGVIIATLTYYICNLDKAPITAIIMFAFITTVMAGYSYGAGMGAIAGAGCGLVIGMFFGQQELMGVMCAMGVIAGAFRELGKPGSCIGVAAGVAGAGMFVAPVLLKEQWLYGAIFGIVIVMFLPKQLAVRMPRDRPELNIVRPADVQVGDKLNKLAKAFEMLAARMSSSSWKHQDFDVTEKQLSTTLEVVDTYEWHEERFARQVAERIESIWKSRMRESQNAVAAGLIEMSEIVRTLPAQTYGAVALVSEQEEWLKIKLKLNKIKLQNISVLENKSGRYEVSIEIKVRKRGGIQSKVIEKILSEIIGRKMVINNGREWIMEGSSTQKFIEEPNFMAVHSVARRIKNSESVSGDNFTFMEFGNGQVFMSISDGMGSGAYAFNESETVVEMLEQLLESGFKEDVALKLVNSVLVLNNADSLATVDMGIINLYSGICNFLKLGAAATFVKRGDWVECLGSTSLPIGVLGNVDIESTSKKLYDGDFIIMLSDGVTDSIGNNGNEKIAGLIMSTPTNNPREMAEAILKGVCSYASGEEETVRDDMTVLVAGVWNKG
ncbi:MAG: SpoIIE family protein phosphatase [Eubacterium sp.]